VSKLAAPSCISGYGTPLVIYLYLVFDIVNEIDGRACSLLDRDSSDECHVQRVSVSPETSGVSPAFALTGVSLNDAKERELVIMRLLPIPTLQGCNISIAFFLGSCSPLVHEKDSQRRFGCRL